MTTRIITKGHAWRGVETNVYDDHRYVCECGDRGFPAATIELCREDHRAHKARVAANGRDPLPNMIQRVETRERHEMWDVLMDIGIR